MVRNLFLWWNILIFLFLGACQSSTKEEIEPIRPVVDIEASDGSLSELISSIPTTEPVLALTFNGLANRETMEDILEQLKLANVQATFFVEGIRVAQEPELVEKMIAEGHDVQNGTLNFLNMEDLNYEETYEEIVLANEVFEKHLNFTPQYVRSRSGSATEHMQAAASMLSMDGVVEYSINPQDRKMQDSEDLVAYVERFLSSGAIIHLNTYINPAVIDAIPEIIQYSHEQGYRFTTLSELVNQNDLKKKLHSIEGFDALQKNSDYKKQDPLILMKKDTQKKEVALTFNGFASEETTRNLLSVLEAYDLKSTFFLTGKNVEETPHLAKLIMDAGHEVGNHSYDKGNFLKMSKDEIQEDLIKAHEVLTYALQQSPLLYFRPPEGEIDDKTAQVALATGLKAIVLYDVASMDWDERQSKEDIFARVMERVKPGSIIQMHLLDGTNTVEALPEIIEALHQQDYSFVKLSSWFE